MIDELANDGVTTETSEEVEMIDATASGTTNNNASLIADLKDFIEFLESKPELETIKNVHATIFQYEKADFLRTMQTIGSGEKVYGDTSFEFVKDFGHIRLSLWSLRKNVCQKVQTGTQVVKKYEIKPEFKNLDIGGYVEVEEPVYEWECPGSLLAEVAK